MSVKIDLNHAGMQSILTSAEIRARLRAEAERIATRARATAPVASGEYRDSITVVDATTDRAVARVVAGASHAGVVEAKTGNLSRALGG